VGFQVCNKQAPAGDDAYLLYPRGRLAPLAIVANTKYQTDLSPQDLFYLVNYNQLFSM
jgi:hypothetical protein